MAGKASRDRHGLLPCRAVLAGSLLGLLLASLPSPPLRADSEPVDGCALTVAGELRTVTAVPDGENLTLDDGSEVRLAGIVAPRAFDTATPDGAWPPETDAVSALTSLALGRRVSIRQVSPRTDRYGRRVAHVFVEVEGRRWWLQEQLLAAGHARAFGIGEAFACAARLVELEQPARLSGTGLWRHAAYHERAAYRTRELMRLRGTLQIVTGRVRKVSETKGAIYLNFGSEWQQDFTAGVRLSRGAAWPQAFLEMVKGLEGHRVRVRGFVERRNGPYVEIAHPAALEIVAVGGEPSGGMPPLAVNEE